MGIPHAAGIFLILGFYVLIIVIFLTSLALIARALTKMARDVKRLADHFEDGE